ELEKAYDAMLDAKIESDEGAGVEVAERAAAAAQTYKEKSDGYDLMRGLQVEKYPLLAKFSEREQGTSGLEAIASQKTGPGLAAFLGEEIVGRLTNIDKVRKGLASKSDVNVWHLPKLVGLVTR